MNPRAIYWIDLETTGLDPTSDKILEMSISRAPFGRPFDASPIFDGVFTLRDWSHVWPYVLEMHHKSGLMIECMRGGTIRKQISNETLEQFEDDQEIRAVEYMLTERFKAFKNDWLPQDGDKEIKSDELPVLAGSSVHFDRGFLNEHMLAISKRFSHRYYDVSALKLFCRSFGMEQQLKAEKHRAKEDIVESIQHAKECMQWLAMQNLASKLEKMAGLPPF